MADTEVQQIKDRINIVEVIGQYVQLRKAGRNYSGRCPFHNERTPSFMVSPERGTYMCFGCGEKGDVFSFVQKIDGLDFYTVLKQLADKAGVELVPRSHNPKAAEERAQEQEHDERLRAVCEAAVGYFEAELKKRPDVLEYLHTRGVSDESIAAWRLGYAPATWDSLAKHLVAQGFGNPDIVDAGFGIRSEKRQGEIFDRFRGRIIFPIFDAGGAPIAVSGRFFEWVAGQKQEGEPAKYVNSPETSLFKKSRVLYGLDRARAAIRKADCILLVEGQFDLVLAHQSGLPFTVALSGTALTPEHLSIVGRLSKRLVLALDGDQAGVRSGLKSALMAIGAGFEVKVPTFPAGADPADLAKQNPELLKAAIRTSATAVEFFLEALRPGAKDARAYQRTVEAQVLPLVAALASAIEREHFVRIVAHKLNVSEEAVRTEVAKRPTLSEPSPEIQPAAGESLSLPLSHLPPMEKKVGMLLFCAPGTHAALIELLGESYIADMRTKLGAHEEELIYSFDREVHDDTTPELVAADMLGQVIELTKRAKMKLM